MSIVRFFDKLEDKIRGWFSHRPIFYGIIGGIGIVLFWRGVWHMVDFFSAYFLFIENGGPETISFNNFWDGLLSFSLGTLMLLSTGLFVSSFIGNEIIISGLRGEKKLSERTEAELKTETGALARLEEEVRILREEIKNLEAKVK